MLRQSFDVDLRSHEHRLHDRDWHAVFLHRGHVFRPWVGQVIRFYPTPGEAVREGAWEALSTPAPDPVTEESPP